MRSRRRSVKPRAAVATGTTRRALRSSVQASALTAVLGVPISLVVLPLVLRGVGLRDFGTWATLSTVLALAQLSEVGVGTEVTRRIAAAAGRGNEEELQKAIREGTTLLTILGVVVACVGVVAAAPIVSLVFPDLGAQERTQVVLVLIGLLLQLCVGLALAGYFAVLSALQRSDFNSYIGLAGRLASLPALVVLIHFGFGLWSLFLSNLFASVLVWVGQFWAVRHVRPDLRYQLERPRPKALMPYFGMSFVAVAANFSNLFDYQFDKLLLTHYRGSEAAGIYQIGTTLSLVARGLALAPIAVLFAATAELHETNPFRLERLERLGTQGTYALGAVLLLGAAAFAPSFIPLWLGAGYDQAVVATQLLSIALLGTLWSAPWYFYALGRGWLKEMAWSALGNALVNATTSFVLIREFGLKGALIGSIAGNAAGLGACYLLLRRRERRAWLSPAWRPTLIVAMTASLAWALTRHEQLHWLHFSLVTAAWLLVTTAFLVATKAAPVKFKIAGGRPAFVVRDT